MGVRLCLTVYAMLILVAELSALSTVSHMPAFIVV